MNTFENLPQSKKFCVRVTGRKALFTDPTFKAGGEKSSLDFPTYAACRGIVTKIYWKPTIEYIIDRVKIVKPVQRYEMGVTPSKADNLNVRDIGCYSYLCDVEYLIEYHYVFNPNRADLKDDWCFQKHNEMIKRHLNHPRYEVFLGTSECPADTEEAIFDSVKSYYDGEFMHEDLLYHSFTYPEMAYDETTRNIRMKNLDPVDIVNGVITFNPPWATLKHIPKENL